MAKELESVEAWNDRLFLPELDRVLSMMPT
jgi:hypothetical protein